MSNYQPTGRVFDFTGEISFISEERQTRNGKPVTNIAIAVIAGRSVKRFMCVAFGSLSKVAQMYTIGEVVTFSRAVEQLNNFTDEAGKARSELQYIVNDIAPAGDDATTADISGDNMAVVETETEIPF